MSGKDSTDLSNRVAVTPAEAQQLLTSAPARPRRQLTLTDHLWIVATIALAYAAGLLALSGHAWWAVIPAFAAVLGSHHWVSRRQAKVNEPRLKATMIVNVIFTVWLLIPVWRGIAHGETIPFPEAFLFAGFAPAAWLIFYLILLIRR